MPWNMRARFLMPRWKKRWRMGRVIQPFFGHKEEWLFADSKSKKRRGMTGLAFFVFSCRGQEAPSISNELEGMRVFTGDGSRSSVGLESWILRRQSPEAIASMYKYIYMHWVEQRFVCVNYLPIHVHQ